VKPPFVLPLDEMRRIWGPGFTDAELEEMAKRASEIAYVTLEELAGKRRAHAVRS
jgi:hypothetical protein